jgi:hypothetical protein
MAFPGWFPTVHSLAAALFAYRQFSEPLLLLVKKTKCFAALLQRHYLAYPCATPMRTRQGILIAARWDPWQRGLPGSMSNGDKPRRLERRWAPRYSFNADLEIEWGSALIRGRTRDISSNGMFIESADPLWIGAGFTARLGLEKPVRVDCFVKRVEPGRGMGVTVSVPEEQQQRYRELLSSLSSDLP